MKKPKELELTADDDIDIDELAQIGAAALLPGMRHLIKLMTAAYQEQASLFQALRNVVDVPAAAPLVPPARRLGRPPKVVKDQVRVATGASSWPTDPEERSKEMKRRQALARARREGGEVKAVKIPGMHPRDVRHPNHAAWVEKMQRVNKAAWERLSPKQRKQRVGRALEGRTTARHAVEELKAVAL
jgi:hypothetical protein